MPDLPQLPRRHGFSLIELAVVTSIVAILAAVALPAFQEQLRKSRRAEAISELGRLALAQEKWRADHATYATALSSISGTATLPSGYYTIAVSTPSGNCANGTAAGSANSFAITATAAGNQTGDSACATLTLTSRCGTIAKTSTPSGGSCW